MHIDTISSNDLSRGVVDGVIPVYKELGLTPLDAIKALRAKFPVLHNVPLSYAGRLDPLAEGVLLILSGSANLERQKYLGLPKTYTVQVLFGIGTDTGDTLGLITKTTNAEIVDLELKEVSKRFIGEYTDTYPVYSSKTVKGVPLFEWARTGKLSEVEIPTYTSQIFSINSSSVELCDTEKVKDEIMHKIDLVHGDFRQNIIKESWSDFLENDPVLYVSTIAVSCASGVYMRGLVNRIAESLNSYAIAFHIQRDSVSDVHISDCIRLS